MIRFLSLRQLTLRTYSEESHMTVDITIAARRFQFAIKIFKQGMLDFYFAAANATSNVMMDVACYLVTQTALARLSGVSQPVSRQEFQRAINGRFCEARKIMPGLFVNFGR